MRTIALFIILFCFFSCHKNEDIFLGNDSHISLEPAEYYLNFDIRSVNYSDPDSVTSFHIEADQVLETEIILLDIDKIRRYIPFMYNTSSHSDSLTLLAVVDFISEEETGFDNNDWNLEFLFREGKDKLEAISDSSYQYISNAFFYEKLIQHNWGNQQLFGSSFATQLLLSFPASDVNAHGWQLHNLSSNGFYFPHEQLILESIDYKNNHDEIIIRGSFETDIKDLSCGWWSHYNVLNATFRTKIK